MKRRSIVTFAALALAGGLAACATATPYQPAVRGTSVSGGFSDARIADNRFRVTFSGNSLTKRETVERYLLFRAAELTTQTGYDWFELVDKQTDRNARTVVDPDPFMQGIGPYGYGYWRPSWRMYGPGFGWRTWDPFMGGPWGWGGGWGGGAWGRGGWGGGGWGGGWGGGYDVRTIEKFEATGDIMLHRGPAPMDNPRAFDARQVLANLGPTVVRPVEK